MMRSLFSGVSGLTTNMLRMDVIGSNVANVNTVGFKTSRVTFQEAMNQTLQGASSPSGSLGGTNPTQVGTGAQLGAIDGVFSQGSLESTGINTDLAIQGRAFFLLADGTTPVYTRAGSFQLDGTGQLVMPGTGYSLQGYACDRLTGQYAPIPTAIRLPVGQVEPARETSEMRVRGNLDADSESRGVRAESGVMYAPNGTPATAATTLDDLKGDTSGAVDLLSAGDTISFSAMVGRSPVSGSLTVAATTTLGDLLSAVETALNSVPGITGLTASIDAEGRIQIATPDSLGEAGKVSGLVIQAQDGNSVARDDFNGVASITTTQTARDAGVFVDESTIYDSLGFTHTLRLEFQRVLGANQFTWQASVDGGDTPVLSGGSGKVNFNADGSVNGFFFDQEGNTLPSGISVGPTTGAATPMLISIDPGDAGTFAGMTMTRGPATLDATGNGFGKGTAVDFSIDLDGTISTIFSNGVTRAVARVALAEFVNPGGLERAGDNVYQSSVNSGDATIGQAGGAIDATVNSGSLEQSNVDLAREFTNMILAQRGFQASARTITASDEVLNDLLNLRR